MAEEYHGIWNDGKGPFKQLYGWGTLTTHIWLPSLSELVGITGTEHPDNGTYYSAMQGLNTASLYYTDAQGGNQFAYFQQYNTSGGKETIATATNQHSIWTRSPVYAYADRSNSFYTGTGHSSVSESRAVHPAVLYNP